MPKNNVKLHKRQSFAIKLIEINEINEKNISQMATSN
jgi:hypothetical protein